jgi:alpha-L-fucosidase
MAASLLVWSLAFLLLPAIEAQYEPTWSSIDSRPLPVWYDESKIGIFLHWGVFSVPSFGIDHGNTGSGEWFWNLWENNQSAYVDFVARTQGSSFAYPDYASSFTAEFFNATAWADLFKASGARYVVPTSKHHEGFCNWPSATSFNWNSYDVGPRRDLIGELSSAVKGAGLHFGVYHSLYEWYNGLYLADEASNFTTTTFLSKTFGELQDLVARYEPELIWSDGDGNAPDAYWDAPKNFLAWLVNESPVADTVVFNDRWGANDTCKHGSYFTCADRYLPDSKQAHKWENAFTLDMDSWGFRRNAGIGRYLSLQAVVQTVVETVSLGGNALINIGPAHDGTINPVFQERLLGLGAWLAVNGDSIYATTPWRAQNETAASAWYTLGADGETVFSTIFAWPPTGALTLATPVPSSSTTVSLLGAGAKNLTWAPLSRLGAAGIVITMPAIMPGSDIAAAPAWTLALAHVA